jgi:hypothetical protein
MLKCFKILILFLFFASQGVSQNFGEFASAVYLNNCSSTFFHNVTGTGANCINPTCATVFNGSNFGTFNQNSNGLEIRGGEIKTWKNGGGNVCSARMNYIVYPTGSRPGAPAFNTINLPFKAGCNAGTFADGLGPCGGNDQKWNTESAGPFDLTDRAPGDYTLEIYFDYTGDDNSSSLCRDIKYINNGNHPTNYTATFTVVASGGACTMLPIELSSFIANCSNEDVLISWKTESENRNDYFLLQKSIDGVNFETISKINSSGNGNSTTENKYAFLDLNSKFFNNTYYRLVQVDFDGKNNIYGPIAVECYETNSSYFEVFPNPTNGGSFEIFLQEKNKKGISTLKMFDLKGSVVFLDEVVINSGFNKFTVNQQVASGIYFIELDNSIGYKKTKKIIINN